MESRSMSGLRSWNKTGIIYLIEKTGLKHPRVCEENVTSRHSSMTCEIFHPLWAPNMLAFGVSYAWVLVLNTNAYTV